MNTSLEALNARIRDKQRQMQKEYDCRTPIGERIAIHRESGWDVDVLVNQPRDNAGTGRPYFINLHGGGFIEGDAMTMGSYCQMLADRLGAVVFNVNYRLSPDYVYPSQVDEICAVLDHIMADPEIYGVDPTRGGIGGFSAGATLAAGVAVKRILDEKPGLKACVLGYPLVSFLPEDMDNDSPYPAADDDMMKAMDFFADGHQSDPVCSPLAAGDEVLRRFPATVLITCGKDSLGMQGAKFAGRLMENGVTLVYKRFLEALHGFIEVNREDYFSPDPRKNPEQMALNVEAENMIAEALKAML